MASKNPLENRNLKKKKHKKKIEMNWAGPILAQPRGLGWCSIPQQQGWTQPSRVGWADVPAHNNHDWLLCMSTVTS